MTQNWLEPQGIIIDPENGDIGPQGCYFHGVGRYSDPSQLGICVKCGQHIGAPIHGEWRERVRLLALRWTAQESSWNADRTQTSPTRVGQGLFQSYTTGENNVELPVVIPPVLRDDLSKMKPLRWASKWGEGEFQSDT